ncbi:hypothetical protein ACFWP2_32415 [Kitasatospora sp. NPDC058444]|uniref:hypothetical protein n=1 Tax=Kitasatospora sp. NPDC058444 TaxID=3346504 RepID=UPI003661E1E1
MALEDVVLAVLATAPVSALTSYLVVAGHERRRRSFAKQDERERAAQSATELALQEEQARRSAFDEAVKAVAYAIQHAPTVLGRYVVPPGKDPERYAAETAGEFAKSLEDLKRKLINVAPYFPTKWDQWNASASWSSLKLEKLLDDLQRQRDKRR